MFAGSANEKQAPYAGGIKGFKKASPLVSTPVPPPVLNPQEQRGPDAERARKQEEQLVTDLRKRGYEQEGTTQQP